MPLFSVVIPLYNKENCIRATLMSALDQDYDSYEIIVVDDGSTDDSLKQIQDLLSSKIQVIHQENAGVAVARNSGIAAAQGAYVAFLDADDIWHNDYLSEIAALTESYPDADMFVTAYNVVLSKSTVVYSSNEPVGVQGIEDSYWKTLSSKYDFVWTSATVVRKSVLEKAGLFKPGELIGQDLDLWSRIAQINPAVAFSTNRCVDYKRDAENNARTRIKVAYPQAFMKTLEYEMGNSKRSQEELQAISSKFRKKMIAYIYTSILNGDRSKARHIISDWSIGKTRFYAFSLYVASFLPEWILRKVYAVRLKVF